MLSQRTYASPQALASSGILKNSGPQTAENTAVHFNSPGWGVDETCNPQKMTQRMLSKHSEKPIKIISYLGQRSKSRTLTTQMLEKMGNTGSHLLLMGRQNGTVTL